MDALAQTLRASPLLMQAGWVTLLLSICAAVYFVARVWVVGFFRRMAARSATTWDDALVDSEVFRRLAHFAPGLVAFYGVQLIPNLNETVELIVQRAAVAIMIAVGAITIGGLLSAVDDIYSRSDENRHRPIKGYLTVVRIAIYMLAAVSVVANLLGQSPLVFVSGVGAMSAVLMLIFKDTILSVVASIQITGNNMLKVGDWVEIPQFGADGDVIDVALHTVQVRNWDKTITTVPTHALVTGSFKNWAPMSASGGRRIKRSISIDVSSVRFLEPGEEEHLAKWALLRDYLNHKRVELDEHNADSGRDLEINADIRRLTNLGTLREYIVAYLRAHPKIHHSGMTLMVRQLQPGPEGIPIEVYCFTNDVAWAVYEDIQADIFDHIFAIIPELGLRVFQRPSGADMERLAGSGEALNGQGSTGSGVRGQSVSAR